MKAAMNSKTLQFFLTILSAYSMICIPHKMHAQDCCEEDNQAGYDHWLWNRKVLLVAVPVVAGAAAVALATSSHNTSFYTGYPYGSPFFYDSSEFYDYYYDIDYYSGSSFDPFYSEYSSSPYVTGYDVNYSNPHHHELYEPSHHIAKSKCINIKPVVTVEKINAPVTFTASVKSADGSFIESRSLTVDKPGTLNFDPISADKANTHYHVELTYAADDETTLEGVLATTLSSEQGEQAQTTPFKNAAHQSLSEIKQDFTLVNES